MTVESFKQQYPEYSSLEGVALWDMMERVKLLQQALEQKDGDGPPEYEEFVLDGVHYTVDKKILKFFESDKSAEPVSESYRMNIIDFSKPDELYSIISEPPQDEKDKYEFGKFYVNEDDWVKSFIKKVESGIDEIPNNPEMDQEAQKKFFDEMEKEFWWDRILNRLKK